MKTVDLIGTAITSTFRSKTRTVLTVLSIFIGAFTLTLTSGLGTGINQYIDTTVASIGVSNVMTVTKQAPQTDAASQQSQDGPRTYDPDAVTRGGAAGGGGTVQYMTQSDIDTLAAIDGITEVDPVRNVNLDYVQVGDGTRYVASIGALIPGQKLEMATGSAPSTAADAYEVAIPPSYVEPLGFSSDDDAVGKSIVIALTDATHTQQTVTATIAGVTEDTFNPTGTSSLTPSDALTTKLNALQSVGLPADQVDRFTQASATFSADATDAEITALKNRVHDAGYTGTTLADQLGSFKTIIDAIVLVLNVFAVIALLAASFGIVNTLLMSVQERTREIGLMKAMGMGSVRVFSLFSLEAAFIGFLGSAIGALIAMLVGTAASSALSGALLSGLPGLSLVAFNPVTVVGTILIIMLVAFLAGTLPAWRAARQDPVESLRYE
ncbi:ABC transporter permease [Leifsonia sp. NPDC058194]|uniref:ABC transporter permease n=1 Tax=Leifsonia sp. NPDC058194 TaxID=3346374 RepID=UPI0036DEB495